MAVVPAHGPRSPGAASTPFAVLEDLRLKNHASNRRDAFAFEFHSISYTELIDLPLSSPIRAFSVFGRAFYRVGIEKRLYGQTELIFIVSQLLRRRCLRRSGRRIPGLGFTLLL